jgi:glycosyltransferase involved in cell wall biosynthesis
VQSLSLQGRVHLLGFREDVPRLLSAFDVYALPSFSEGQSLALMEAMAARLPIVASRVGGNPELVREGESGLLFTAGDAEDLAGKLKLLLDSPARAESMGVRARERAVRDFSLDAMMAHYRRLYAEAGLAIRD